MKAILEYNLPEDEEEFTVASKGRHMWLALWDLSQCIRAKYKYSDDDNVNIEEMSKTFYDILEKHNISLEELS